ncbi:MAG: cupin domain-containing protein [Dehalococcoidia bacterium]
MSGGGGLFVRRTEGAVHRTPFGDALRWIAGGEATRAGAGAGFSVQERVAPPGSRSFPHVHHHFIEAFYVLDGAFDFEVGGEQFAAAEGAFVLAPRGVSHAWRNAGEVPAKALVFFTPSADARYFEELDAVMNEPGDPDPARLQALAEQYRWT